MSTFQWVTKKRLTKAFLDSENLVHVETNFDLRGNVRTGEVMWFKSERFVIRVDMFEADCSIFESRNKVFYFCWNEMFELTGFTKFYEYETTKPKEILTLIAENLKFHEWEHDGLPYERLQNALN
jgi:hypothetical protein